MSSILYITKLGLKLLAAVKFIITNVDPHDPERVFSFSIRLDKSTNSWSSKSLPRVIGALLPLIYSEFLSVFWFCMLLQIAFTCSEIEFLASFAA